MTILDGTKSSTTNSHSGGGAYHASMTRLPGGTVGLITITQTTTPSAAVAAMAATQTPKRNIFNVILDNSASMGGSTKEALQAIVRPVLMKGWFDETLVTLFDVSSHTYSIPDLVHFDKMMARLPTQRSTNITKGVEDSMIQLGERLAALKPEMDVQVLTMLLTDGGHNEGTPISAPIAAQYRQVLQRKRSPSVDDTRLFHTVVPFCLTSESDAKASMIVKEVIETAKIPGLPNIFYAKTHSEMAVGLTEVLDACDAIFAGDESGAGYGVLKLGDGAEFIATGQTSLTHRFTPLQPETFAVTLGADSNWMTINGVEVPVVEIPLQHDGISLALVAVREALQPLTRQAVAFNVSTIEKRLASLEALVSAIDEHAAQTKKHQHDGLLAKTPQERRAMLKRVVSTQYGLHEIRNVLCALRVKGRSNSDSISLLTGNQRKYAHIASQRSGTEKRSPEMVARDTATHGGVVQDLILQDLAVASARGLNLESVVPATAITLQTNIELLRQWADPVIEDPAEARQTNDERIMDILSYYGIAAFPVKLKTSDATQVDLMQLEVTDTLPQLVDSASMMMSWRMNAPIKLADGQHYTELLLLVDPAAPRASTHVLSKTMLVQHLMSAMISKDLYMYLPSMHASMHTHSFVTAVSKAVTLGGDGERPVGSFIKLALHIVYSARKLWESGVIFDDMSNLDRWINQLQTVTRSAVDVVYHVAALSLKLALSSIDINQVDDRTALLHQLNEHLARRLAWATSTYAAPAAFAQELFDIQSADAPQPTDNDLEAEPDEASIRLQCRKHVSPSAVNGVASSPAMQKLGTSTVLEFVEAEWITFYRLHAFTIALREALAAMTKEGGVPVTMDKFCEYIESKGEVPDELVASVQDRMLRIGTDAPSMWRFLGVERKERAKTAMATVMQACLYPGNSDRSGVVHTKDVTDPEEQRAMIEELYMVHYRVQAGFKRNRRTAVIGEVTAMQASTVDVDTFVAMIGTHTHGHPRRVFWGMLRGLLADASIARSQQKLAEFKARSSAPGFDSVMKKAWHGRR